MFCYEKLRSNLGGLAKEYGEETSAHAIMRDTGEMLQRTTIEGIFETGLHEFLQDFIGRTSQLGNAIAADYRFIE